MNRSGIKLIGDKQIWEHLSKTPAVISTYPQELGWQWEEGRQGRQWSYSSPTSGEGPLRQRKSEMDYLKKCFFMNFILEHDHRCSGKDLRGWWEPTNKDKNLVVWVPQQHGNGQSLKEREKRLVDDGILHLIQCRINIFKTHLSMVRVTQN